MLVSLRQLLDHAAENGYGVPAFNINNLEMTGAMRRAMANDPGEFDPRKFLKEAMIAARELCKDRFEAFGCAGQAPRIKPVPLEKMAARYAKGELRVRAN